LGSLDFHFPISLSPFLYNNFAPNREQQDDAEGFAWRKAREVNPAHQAVWRSQAQSSDALGERLGVNQTFPFHYAEPDPLSTI